MRKALIMGAAGRDFHNFNTYFRNNKYVRVVAFTATQIPDIDGRKYPADLTGNTHPEYKDGIPIYAEEELERLIQELEIDDVYFSYSDVPYHYVMSKSALVNKCGANFILLGPEETMIKSNKPVVSICAVRTGCGKSQTTRRVAEILMEMGHKVAAIRHPMPYGDLVKQKVQKFETIKDLKDKDCTIEEMEEYEPHIRKGIPIYAGVDYQAIVDEAEKTADIILWDGGNNDFPFYKADLEIVVLDPHRPGHELKYYPGEVNFRRADVLIINKVDSADLAGINQVKENIKNINPDAQVIEAASPVFVEGGEQIKGKRVLVVEDGPTLTHGEMKYGAGIIAANKYGAAELVDPRPYAVRSITDTFKKYPEIGILLPAMGYGDAQMKDLEETINNTDCDLVVIATPIDLGRIVKFNKPAVRVTYELGENSTPILRQILKDKFPKE